ncbi:MAG: hypothetical protein ABUS56_04635 [Acidobacteriota bacterium]
MTRVRRHLAATLAGALFAAGAAFAQGTPPPFTPILSGKTFVPPIKGAADIEYTKPVPKREKDNVIIRLTVKNVSNAPIARLSVAETWYDKGGATIAGGQGAINGLLQPGEVKTLTVEMPYNPKLSGDKMQFSHANGSVNSHLVSKIGDAASADPAKAAPKKK